MKNGVRESSVRMMLCENDDRPLLALKMEKVTSLWNLEEVRKKILHSTSRKKNKVPPGHHCATMRHKVNVHSSGLYDDKLMLLCANKQTVYSLLFLLLWQKQLKKRRVYFGLTFEILAHTWWGSHGTAAHTGSGVRKQRGEQWPPICFLLLTHVFQTPSTME